MAILACNCGCDVTYTWAKLANNPDIVPPRPRPAFRRLQYRKWRATIDRSASTAAHHLRSLQLLLPDCVRFSCCSPLASASAAAPRLRPLEPSAAAPGPRLLNCCSPIILRPLRLLLPDCVRFNCCSSRLRPLRLLHAPRLHPLVPPAVPALALEHSSRSSVYSEVRRSRVTSLVPPHEHPTSVTHRQTHTHTHTR